MMKVNVLDFARRTDLVAESFQRTKATGSHSKAFAETILQDCANNREHYCGAIHVSKMENGQYSILDGNSRLHDFREWLAGNLQVKYPATEIKKDGTTREVLKKGNINEVPAYIKSNIESAMFYVVEMESANKEERAEMFKMLNTNKSLTAQQKAAVIMPDSFYAACDRMLQFMQEKEMLTDAQRLNDVHVHAVAQIIANVNGVYASGNKKLMENIRGIDIDVDKFNSVLNMLSETEMGKNDKYELITLVSICYNDDLTVAEVADLAGVERGFNNCNIRISDFLDKYTPNCVHCSFDTAGANSAIKNAERFAKMLKKIKAYMAQFNTESHSERIEQPLTLAEAARVAGL